MKHDLPTCSLWENLKTFWKNLEAAHSTRRWASSLWFPSSIKVTSEWTGFCSAFVQSELNVDVIISTHGAFPAREIQLSELFHFSCSKRRMGVSTCATYRLKAWREVNACTLFFFDQLYPLNLRWDFAFFLQWLHSVARLIWLKNHKDLKYIMIGWYTSIKN